MAAMRLAPSAGLAFLSLLAAATPRTAPAADDVLRRMDAAFQQVVARVSPSVVQIQVFGYSAVEGPDGAALARQRTIGSGVIVAPDGYVVTNHHVIRGAQRIRVVLPAAPGDSPGRGGSAGRGRLFEARVVGLHAETDLALLKIDARGLPALPLGSTRPLKPGQLVWAVGSPQGLASTVTMGVISSVARQTPVSGPMLFVQTDAPINPGNSGGPLVDSEGTVVGVNTFILSQSGGSQGLGFAIPAGVVKFVVDSLRRHGQVRRVEMGIGAQEVTPTMAAGLGLMRDYGVIVSDATPGGPAAAAGVLPGDLVEAVDGRPIDSMPAMAIAMYQHAEEAPVKLTVRRGAELRTMEVAGVVPRLPDEQLQAMATPEKNLVARLGILGVTLTPELAELASTLRRSHGVVVAARLADPATVESGLQTGDVIHFVNRTSVEELAGLRAAVDAIKVGAPVVLTLERQGKLIYLSFEME
jgi:serine protease Do